MTRPLSLFLVAVAGLLADDAHQRQVVRLGNLSQMTPKKGKHKVPQPYTAQKIAKPSKRAKQTQANQPVWGYPDKKNARPKH